MLTRLIRLITVKVKPVTRSSSSSHRDLNQSSLHMPTFWRMQQFIQLLVPAHPAAVEERVQRLLLAVLGQAAEPVRARPGVHAARLALFERARLAAAAAGLLDELTAHRHRRTHVQALGVARLARHVGRAAARDAQQRNHQERQAQQHCARGSSELRELACERTINGGDQLSWAANPSFGNGLSPIIRGAFVASTGALRAYVPKCYSIRSTQSTLRFPCAVSPAVTDLLKKERKYPGSRFSPYRSVLYARALPLQMKPVALSVGFERVICVFELALKKWNCQRRSL